MKRSALTIAVIFGVILLTLPIHAGVAACHLPPVANAGLLDLSRWEMDRDGPVQLAGEWELCWSKLIAPDDSHMGRKPESAGWFAMPAVWNGVSVNGRGLGGNGFAPFRLRLRFDPRQSLLIPYAFTAYRLWIDDQAAVAVGRVVKSAGAMVPMYRATLAFLDPQVDGEAELTKQ